MKTTSILKHFITLRLLLGLLLCLCNYLHYAQIPVLWSSSFAGGRNGQGAIFKINANGTGDTAVHQFNMSTGGGTTSLMILGNDGKFYGTSTFQGPLNQSGVIFSFDPLTRVHTELFDFDYMSANGGNAYSNLAQAGNGLLFGANGQSSGTDLGVMYAYNPANDQYQVVYNFSYSNHPASQGPMVASDGNLYGTLGSNQHCYGSVYSITPTGALTTYALDTSGQCRIGQQPAGNFLEAEPGILYATCQFGGDKNKGTLFSFNMQTHAFTRLFSFDSIYGTLPAMGALTAGNDGKAYGVTSHGGTHNAGVIYSIDTATHAYTKLADFHDTLGITPWGTLLLASDGKLYGATQEGGDPAEWMGTIFSFDRVTHQIHVIRNMHSNDSIGYGIAGFIEYGTPHNTTTGIAQPTTSDKAYKVFPNPARSKVVVTTDKNLLEKPVIITDIIGEVMYKSVLSATTTEIDCSNWKAGVYLVSIEGAAKVTKLIIGH